MIELINKIATINNTVFFANPRSKEEVKSLLKSIIDVYVENIPQNLIELIAYEVSATNIPYLIWQRAQAANIPITIHEITNGLQQELINKFARKFWRSQR